MINLKRFHSLLIASLGLLSLLTFLPTDTQSSSAYLRQILTRKNGLLLQSLFTPRDNIRKVLIELINHEQESLQIAIYYLTDPQIATAITKAKKRGVSVSIITEATHLEKCAHTKIFELHRLQIPVRVFCASKKTGIMHHKYMVCRKNLYNEALVASGSFNYTTGAHEVNRENIQITNHSETVQNYLQNYLELEKETIPIEIFLGQRLDNYAAPLPNL